MRKRHILTITGSRADYGLSTSIFKAIRNHPKLKFSLVVTGIHLLDEYGYMFKEIEKDGFDIIGKIKIDYKVSDGASMSRAIGKQITSLTEIINKENPNIILVLTDLGHALAGAIAGAHMNIPIAHYSGGDVSGSIDESIRHAITKFSHIHFPTTKKSADRIIRMGEDSWRVYHVGSAGLDDIFDERATDRNKLKQKFNLDLSKSLLMVIQHPITTEYRKAGRQMEETMKAIKELKQQTIMGYPNSDAGRDDIVKVIKKYKRLPFIRTYKNMNRHDYLGLMKVASVMIGNSSSGITEAPSFGLPVVNVGTRQKGRERAENVIDVDYNREEIKRAIKKALYNKNFISIVKKKETPYGDGKTGKRIADILARIDINEKLLEKKITY